MKFEWDEAKEAANKAKHGISFDEATELFSGDVDFLEIYDTDHSDEEDRFIAIGPLRRGLVVVVYTERDDHSIRIISARPATRNESHLFEMVQGVET